MPYTNAEVPFVGGSDTSLAAALDYEKFLKADMSRVYNCVLASLDGMTCDEVEVFLSMRHQTASARLRDLVLANMVYDTGVRRKTRSGCTARVYMGLKRENGSQPEVAGGYTEVTEVSR
jgi:hypothetical protein